MRKNKKILSLIKLGICGAVLIFFIGGIFALVNNFPIVLVLYLSFAFAFFLAIIGVFASIKTKDIYSKNVFSSFAMMFIGANLLLIDHIMHYGIIYNICSIAFIIIGMIAAFYTVIKERLG